MNTINHSLRLTLQHLFIIWTPPKVGSTSLVSSLRISNAYKYDTLHIHNEDMLSVLCGIQNTTIHEIIQYNQQLGLAGQAQGLLGQQISGISALGAQQQAQQQALLSAQQQLAHCPSRRAIHAVVSSA